jgi:hypothetical protein
MLLLLLLLLLPVGASPPMLLLIPQTSGPDSTAQHSTQKVSPLSDAVAVMHIHHIKVVLMWPAEYSQLSHLL